ncbi:MAG: gliding motility-associated protein GldE [Chitinophagaceae bacterium]|nr:gliding motility-associated protein GldE [Chitinophagaceae bacterium]
MSTLYTKLSFVLLSIDLQGSVVLSILLVVLVFLSFTISRAEVALFSLNNKDLNVLKTKQHDEARRILELLEEPKEVYATLLIAGTFINICIVVLSNYLIDQNIPFGNMPPILQMIIKVIAIAFMLLFVCEILPRIYATQNVLRGAYRTSFVVEIVHAALRKISRWVVSLSDGIGKRLGANKSEALSIRELDEAIDIKSDEEASPAEKNIMKGIVKFGNISVKQIMRSRLDVSGIEYDTSFADLNRRIEELHYSRLPVYKVSLDEVVGIINTKDLIAFLNEPDNFDWHPLMRQPYFVPESKPIEDLLKDFQTRKIHFAVVVDEFGGTSGIVTMEDILEEVIGEIRDEFDEEETGNRKLDENNYIVEGKTMIHDLCKMMQLPMDTFDAIKGESESVGGLVLELAGEFPKLNEEIMSGDFIFTVLEVDKNRVKSVKVTMKREE